MADANHTARLPRWDSSALEAVCGIANAGGGCVLIPSSKRDYTAGFKKMKRSFEAAPHTIADELGIRCAVEPVMDGSEFCLSIEVPAATEPLSLRGEYWLYTSEGNRRQTHEAVFRAWQEDTATPWELKTLPYVEADDLSGDAVLAIGAIPLSNLDNAGDSLADTVQGRLDHLGLTHPRTKKLVNSGALLLCANPARFIPGASVNITTFDSDGSQLGGSDEVLGPLTALIDETVQLICEKHLPAISTTKAFARKSPPPAAIREAVTNALLHKDYSSGTPVRIILSPQQLVIQNAGGVPEGWTMEDLVENHSPRFRNPILAASARLLGAASGWGGGINLMRESCTQTGAELPRFELSSSQTAVIFPLPASKRGAAAARNKSDGSVTGRNGGSAGNAAPRIPFGGRDGKTAIPYPTGTDRSAGGSGGRSTFAERSIAAAHKLDMTQTDEYVLQVLTTNGRATAPRIAKVLGVSERTVRRSFKKLREYGFIERIGSDKAGYWSIND